MSSNKKEIQTSFGVDSIKTKFTFIDLFSRIGGFRITFES